MNPLILLAVFFTISIVFSFLCSIWEAVLLSIPPSYVEQKRQEGGSIGVKLKEFKDNIDRPLAAILTLNTIAHTAGAIGVGSSATKLWAGNELVTGIIVPILMTMAILILSELIPKTLGANSWKGLTNFTVRSLDIIIKLLFPLVWLGQWITKLLKKDKNKSVLSRADFQAMTDLGHREGVFDKSESKIIRNLLRFNSIIVKNVMTPRTVMVAADESLTIKDFYDEYNPLRFSRVPIYKDSKDNVTGFVLRSELLAKLVNDENDLLLKELMRPLMIVNESMAVPDLFNEMIEKREHIALVVGEFGGVNGIVSMEDLIETLLGLEIIDEMDNADDMQMLARKNWEKRAKELGIIQPENKPE